MKYKMSPVIKKYYEHWIRSPKLLGPSDTEKFYAFVKSVLRYSKKRRNGSWFRYFLERDLPKTGLGYEERIPELVALFDHLVDFHHSTKFPDPLIEMRNPHLVKNILQMYKKEDGTRQFSDDEINKTLKKNFGDKWKEKL